jgi:hypothetical protein
VGSALGAEEGVPAFSSGKGSELHSSWLRSLSFTNCCMWSLALTDLHGRNRTKGIDVRGQEIYFKYEK